MHRNYFLFEKQVYSLNRRILSCRISECFTHRRDELVIVLESNEKLFLRIGLNQQTPYILLYKAQVIKDPRIHFFKEIWGKKTESLNIVPYDKIIYITVDNFFLKCVFFGKNRNIFLLDSKNNIFQTFKKTKNSLNSFSKDYEEEIVSPFNLSTVNRSNLTENLRSYSMKRIGGFNKLLTEELCSRVNLDPELILSDISDIQWSRLCQTIISMMNEFKEERCYLYEHPQKMTILSLIDLTSISGGYTRKTYLDINKAWKQFIYHFQQKNNFDRILNRCREKISRRIIYLEKTLKKVSDYKQLEEKKKLSELKGHLLQTFSSEIEPGADLVNLKNIYSPDQEYISIKLNTKISLQKNALRYFNKYKDINEQKKSLKIKKDTYADELNYWRKKFHDTEKIDNLKKAEKLEQLLSQKKLIQKEGKLKKSVPLIDISSFNRILLKQQWEIVIGKNAENNDLLTFKFAHKYDIWLHAQGVSGSHVIIRVPDKNKKPSMDIIEEAASITAFFSGSKNSSTVPVNYTEARYVRKPKKSPAGTVIISHAKTIFVKPKKYI